MQVRKYVYIYINTHTHTHTGTGISHLPSAAPPPAWLGSGGGAGHVTQTLRDMLPEHASFHCFGFGDDCDGKLLVCVCVCFCVCVCVCVCVFLSAYACSGVRPKLYTVTVCAGGAAQVESIQGFRVEGLV